MSAARVVFVTGATATGKSDFALAVAREIGGVIVNCDSVQVYKGPTIASNVPSLEERAQVPHFLYEDVEAPHERTAGEYRVMALERLASFAAETPVFVVGGTGFYFMALERGMFDVPEADPLLTKTVKDEAATADGLALLRRELEAGDPRTAARLSPEDSYRIARAVVLLRSGFVPSRVRESFAPEPFPHPLLKTSIVAERGALRERIAARTERMLERGLLEETRELLRRVPADWAPLRSVGSKEAVRALQENLGTDWLRKEINLRTNQLARRQETWFRKDTDMTRFAAEGGFAAFRETCLRFFEGVGTLNSGGRP